MIESDRVKKILYGGDYNPEQWEEEVWEEDMRLFKLARINEVTLNVFSWANLQPDENTYCFDKLDKIMNLVKENDLKVCLATSTAAHPAWMARKYPDILRTDFNGLKHKFGGRHNSCPNSPTYRKYSVRLAEKLAERYKDYDNIVAWHISNEYSGECFCENCEKAFRVWLEERYHTIDNLNKAWNMQFWGHTLYDFEDVVLPSAASEHFSYEQTTFQGISLDYRRFMSDSMLTCYQLEYDEVKKYTPEIPVTTNLMGFYKMLDYQKWAKYMDFISWDNYPSNSATPAERAMSHSLMRGLKGGKPFALMEQTPSVTNWLDYNALKRPGAMRLWSYQAMAHGADTILFFQMRRSIGACEKYHGAIIDHAGHENTRVFREASALGKELDQLKDKTLGARVQAKAAIVFDWDNWWAVEYSAGPTKDMKYVDEIRNYYSAFHRMNIPVDLISVEDDLTSYELVIAPILYMTKGNYDEKIRTFVKAGGTFVTTFFSGYVNENDLVITGGYPGKLRDILGIWVEESDALPSGAENHFTYQNQKYPAKLLCDLLHLEGADSLADYEEDFYQGMPVITRNSLGSGKAYYVAARSDDSFYTEFIKTLCIEKKIEPTAIVPENVEAVLRVKDKENYLFLLNNNAQQTEVKVPADTIDLLSSIDYKKGDTLVLPAYGVSILSY